MRALRSCGRPEPRPRDAAKAKTVPRELARMLAAGAIDPVTHAADLALYRDVKATAKRLSGTRRVQLAGTVAVVDGIAARGELTPARLAPLRLTLSRNREYWTASPLLASGARVSFPGSQLVWQNVPGQGLALHPLANFGKLNALAKGSRRNDPTTAQMLDELLAVGVPRGGGLAWEYYFTFDGGRPPWVSALAQGTGLQAISRAAVRLGRLPELLPQIRAGLVMFTQAPPTGVRVATPAGAYYAQYSFWPQLQILNGFIQSLVGLYDVGQLTGDPTAQRLFAEGDAEARAAGAAVRHRRMVVLLARRDHARVQPQLPRPAARLPGEPVRPHAGRRLLRRGGELHDLSDRAARAHAAHAARARGRAPRADVLAVEDLPRDGAGHRAGRPGRARDRRGRDRRAGRAA